MTITDKFLARAITLTVCTLALFLAISMAVQSLKGFEADTNIKELTYLIVGGLISQITTRSQKESPAGTQEVSVPDPLPAPAAPVAAEVSDFGGGDSKL